MQPIKSWEDQSRQQLLMGQVKNIAQLSHRPKSLSHIESLVRRFVSHLIPYHSTVCILLGRWGKKQKITFRRSQYLLLVGWLQVSASTVIQNTAWTYLSQAFQITPCYSAPTSTTSFWSTLPTISCIIFYVSTPGYNSLSLCPYMFSLLPMFLYKKAHPGTYQMVLKI